MSFIDFDIRNRMAPLRKLCSITLTLIFKVKHCLVVQLQYKLSIDDDDELDKLFNAVVLGKKHLKGIKITQ